MMSKMNIIHNLINSLNNKENMRKMIIINSIIVKGISLTIDTNLMIRKDRMIMIMIDKLYKNMI
jgi:hypothetical protein